MGGWRYAPRGDGCSGVFFFTLYFYLLRSLLKKKNDDSILRPLARLAPSALPKNAYLVKVIRWLPGNVITGASAVRAGTAADAHGVVMVALGALARVRRRRRWRGRRGARPRPPARPPRAASKTGGVRARVSASPTTASTREVASSRARPPRRPLASRRSSTDATRSRRSVRRGARAPGARARRRRRRRRRGRRRGGGVYYTRRGGRARRRPRAVAPFPDAHDVRRGGDGGAVQRLDAVRGERPGRLVRDRDGETPRLRVSRARGGEPRRRQSRGARRRRRWARVSASLFVRFSCSVRDWPRRSSCMSRRRTSRFCGFSRRWTVKARGIRKRMIWKRRIRQPPPPSETRRCA